ncbi:MAG: ABC transporter permease [Chloroflexi bacterium]|nr:ABC transporter permease [Chloroflexota bacterium]
MYLEEQVPTAVAASELAWVLPRRPGALETVWRFIRRKPLGAFGFLIVFFLVAMTIGAPTGKFGMPSLPSRPLGFELGKPFMARYEVEKQFNYIDAAGRSRLSQFEAPSWEHWLGTDKGGRDTWARIVWGARRSLFVGLWALAVATAAGTVIGVVSGFFRGWLDTAMQRVMDALQSFPALITLILIISINPLTSGPSLTVAAFALGFVGITSVQRIVRGVVLSTREQPYVEAARAIGATDLRIMTYHILPNITAAIIVVFSIGLGSVILAEAALGFIVPQFVPQDPSWGLMLNEGRSVMLDHPSLALFSGLAIALAVLGFNLAGDALRDVLDPRLRLG